MYRILVEARWSLSFNKSWAPRDDCDNSWTIESRRIQTDFVERIRACCVQSWTHQQWVEPQSKTLVLGGSSFGPWSGPSNLQVLECIGDVRTLEIHLLGQVLHAVVDDNDIVVAVAGLGKTNQEQVRTETQH